MRQEPVVDCAVELHRELGPGLLETVYEVTRALARRGLSVRRQVGVAIEYRGEKFDEGFRADPSSGPPSSARPGVPLTQGRCQQGDTYSYDIS